MKVNNMKNTFFILIAICLSINTYAQNNDKPLDNYIIKRLIICNDNDELIVVKYGGTWNIPALRFNKSESYNQALANLTKEMGIKTSKPKIAGIFSFTYAFNSQAALRMFYVANYTSGKLKTKSGWDGIKWISKKDFLKLKNQDVYSLMASKVVEDVSTIWGGAFFLYKKEGKVKFNITEEFYPLR